jgi:hypothetical protein
MAERRCMRFYSYYAPKYKYELILILGEWYPDDIRYFSGMRLNQLKAIYHRIRRKDADKKPLPKEKTLGTL